MATTNRGRRRTVLITGGTGSLGFRTAQALLADGGWDVVITGRTADSVSNALERLGGTNVTGYPVDLGRLGDVRRVTQELPALDTVICNAGVHTTAGTAFTQDGIEQTFGVNHLAHFVLVQELLPTMAKPARVVFVSSGTHDPARRTGFPAPRYTTARELAYPKGTQESPFRAGRRFYTASKLCNVLAAYEFARQISPDVATFNVFDPGQMPGTGLARDYRGVRGFAWRRVMPAFTLVPGNDLHTPKQSAAALVRLVVDPALEGVTGAYFDGIRERRSSAESYDIEKAADLWGTSVALTAELTTRE